MCAVFAESEVIGLNASLVALLRDEFREPVLVPSDSQIVGPFGAALLGMRLFSGLEDQSKSRSMPRLRQQCQDTACKGNGGEPLYPRAVSSDGSASRTGSA
jgi:hypothetical protein